MDREWAVQGLLDSGQVAKAKVGLGSCKEKSLLIKGPELVAEAQLRLQSRAPRTARVEVTVQLPWPRRASRGPALAALTKQQEHQLCHQKQMSPWLCLSQLWDLAQASNLSDI